MKQFKKYQDLSKRKVLSKQEINNVCRAVNYARFMDDKPEEQTKRLEVKSLFEEREYLITKEQSEFGISWLKDYFFTKRGVVRNSKDVNLAFYHAHGDSDDILFCIQNFKQFKFVGLYEHVHPHGGSSYYTPLYRTYAKDGSYFDYSPVHMGVPRIVNIERK